MSRTPETIRLTTAIAERAFTPALLLAAVPADPEGGAESWIQLLKTGEFWDPRYGSFSVTTDTLEQILANFERLNRPVPGDYDHSGTERGDTKACGWVKQLQRRDTELWGLVSWTPTAAEGIRAGEWRYISPEYFYDYATETGEKIGPALVTFALTNRPFLEGMAEVSLAVAPDGAVMLSRPAGRPDDLEAHVDPKKIAEALGLPLDTPEPELLKALTAKTAGDSVTLTRAEHDELLASRKTAEEQAETERVRARDAVLDKAVGDGKIPPAHLLAWKAAYDADPEKVKEQIDELNPLALFQAKGGGGESILPPEVAADAPRSDQVHALALHKMEQKPGLEYEDAVRQADREIERKAV